MSTNPNTTPSEKLLAALAETPSVQAALAERNAAAVLERRGYVAGLKQIERESTAQFPKLVKAAENAAAAVRKAEEVLIAARNALAAANNERSTASFAWDRERTRLESLLRDGAH